jgi:hypothetical protein
MISARFKPQGLNPISVRIRARSQQTLNISLELYELLNQRVMVTDNREAGFTGIVVVN